jgi:protein-L-isoaspartate(D-aspartate) O-methyltransferase
VGEEELRAAMVSRLVACARIRSDAVEQAFRAVPRHLFLPGLKPAQAYRDHAVATKWLDGEAISSASQPSMMAIMLEQLDLRPGHRVLEIGTGTGYNAALIAEMVGPTGSVVSIDIDRDLVEGAGRNLAAAGVLGVVLHTGDGALGYPAGAPYDRIVLTVGSWDIQPAWWSQLVPGGRLLLPLSVGGSQLSVALDLMAGRQAYLLASSVRCCAFVRLRGQGAVSEAGLPLGPDGIALQPARGTDVDVASVGRLFAERGRDWSSSVRLSGVDLWDGFGLWLAVQEPTTCRLLVDQAASRRWPSLLPAGTEGGTLLLAEPDGLAIVIPGATPNGQRSDEADDASPVVVRGYGPVGALLAGRLLALLEQWVDLGRPIASELRLRAYPAGAQLPAEPGIEINKRHSKLRLDWPRNPIADRPILER